jgi:hypothetical protein
VRISVPAAEANVVLLDRLRAIARACAWEANVLEAIMLSCYLQGAMDGRTPEVTAAIRALGVSQ